MERETSSLPTNVRISRKAESKDNCDVREESASVILSPEYLYEHEIAQLDELFTHGVISDSSLFVNASWPSRAQEIFHLIEGIIERAAAVRRRDQSNPNDEWFTAESQLKIRQQVQCSV